MKKVAVVLFNLGGPLTQADVRPFLYNLFSDPFIIGLPAGFRQAVAWLISTRREKSAQANYALMGGGSPIVALTQDQANALEVELNATGQAEFKTFIGMRYWHPFISEAISDLEAWGADEIIALPLYPQFSTTTTETAFVDFKKHYKGKAPVRYIKDYPVSPKFIAAHIDLIRKGLEGLDVSQHRLLFSAHGLPEKIILAGDPYQHQVEQTVAAIMADLGMPIDHLICYQSRVGPLKWIGPSTDETIIETVTAGKIPVVVPIAFVSEHIETLVELDIEYRELAEEAGARAYHRIPALGTDKGFITALADEVLSQIGKGV